VSEIEDVARRYVRSTYGNMVQLGEGTYDEATRLYTFVLRSNYPFMIVDDTRPDNIVVRILKMENLGKVYVRHNRHVEADMCTRRRQVDREIDNTLAHWKRRIEQVVASATSERLANLEQIRQFFMPVQRIVYYVLETGFITKADIERSNRRKKGRLSPYVALLEGQDLLTRREHGWEPSIALKEMDRKAENKNDLMRRLIALMIRERYQALRDLMRLNVLHRTIRLQNIIYLPEIEVHHNLKRTRETVGREYFYHYGSRIDKVDLVSNLTSLVQVGAIVRDRPRNLYSGDEDLLESMIKQAEKLPPLFSLHMTVV